MTQVIFKEFYPDPGRLNFSLDMPIQAKGEVLFTSTDIQKCQQTFLKYGPMQNGSIWGTADTWARITRRHICTGCPWTPMKKIAAAQYGKPYSELSEGQKARVNAEVKAQLKQNRYNPATGVLLFSETEKASFKDQVGKWADFFASGGSTPPV